MTLEPTSVNLHFEFFSLHLPTKARTLSESTKIPYFLVIITGVHQTFGVEKIMLHFVYQKLQKL